MLRDRGSRSSLTALLEHPDLRRIFPAVGIARSQGLRGLEAVRSSDPGLAHGATETQVAAYFRALLASEDRLRELVEYLQSHEAELTGAAFERTRRLLPEQCMLGTVRFAILPLAYDFRTDRESVFMDPLAALAYGPAGIERTLSLELHHVGRYRLTGVNLTLMEPDEEPEPDAPSDVFRSWAAWLEAEGIADCVASAVDEDIPALHAGIERRRQQLAQYRSLLTEVLDRFRQADRRNAADRSELRVLSQELLDLAHPVGAGLAGRILSKLGPTALTACVGQPELFLRSSDRVAPASGASPFGEPFLGWMATR